MRRPTTISAEPNVAGAACMDDVVGLLFADDGAFANFAAWLEVDLLLLEIRFADYCTADSTRHERKSSR